MSVLQLHSSLSCIYSCGQLSSNDNKSLTSRINNGGAVRRRPRPDDPPKDWTASDEQMVINTGRTQESLGGKLPYQ